MSRDSSTARAGGMPGESETVRADKRLWLLNLRFPLRTWTDSSVILIGQIVVPWRDSPRRWVRSAEDLRHRELDLHRLARSERAPPVRELVDLRPHFSELILTYRPNRKRSHPGSERAHLVIELFDGLQITGEKLTLNDRDVMLGVHRFGWCPRRSARRSEVGDVPAGEDETVERFAKPERALHRAVRQVVEREEIMDAHPSLSSVGARAGEATRAITAFSKTDYEGGHKTLRTAN